MLAGAGSGKTRALTRKIAWLVQVERLAPWEILAVTFTNKAAGEMRERCHSLLGDRAADLWLGTFHSIGVRLLRQHGARIGVARNFVIYDDDDQDTLVKRVLKQLNLSDKSYPPRAIRSFIDQQKQLCLAPDDAAIPRSTPYERTIALVYEMYERKLREANAVDFGDLIMLPWRIATRFEDVGFEWRARWRYLLVDEFQDTNHAQYMLLKALLNSERNLCVVGDDDQSIYGWRGAEVEHILDFPKAFPSARVIRFEQNYRSTRPILELSTALIAQNRDRHGKVLWTERDGGEPIRVYAAQTERDEAEWVARRIRDLRGRYSLAEMAVFYRTNAQSRSFEDVLRRERIPYRVFGGLRFYDRAEIKDIVAYLRFVVNPKDNIALERIINRPTRGIGKVTLERLVARADSAGVSLWEALCVEAADSRGKLGAFADLVVELQRAAAEDDAVGVVTRLLDQTDYLAWLTADGSVEGETKAENVRELVSAISEYCDRSEDGGLAGFLEEVALVSALDGGDTDTDMVVLMTAHMAKGLEFDVVFVTGLEEDLMPHINSIESERGLEEERRLTYVAMTRARHHLHLSHAAARMRFGQTRLMTRSRFLDGLPRELLRMEGIAGRGTGVPGFGLASLRDPAAPKPRFGGTSAAAEATRTTNWDPADVADPVPDWAEESQDRDDGVLRPGRRVFHPTFGEGQVQHVEGDGPRAKVSVRFRDQTTRKLIASVLVLR